MLTLCELRIKSHYRAIIQLSTPSYKASQIGCLLNTINKFTRETVYLHAEARAEPSSRLRLKRDEVKKPCSAAPFSQLST